MASMSSTLDLRTKKPPKPRIKKAKTAKVGNKDKKPPQTMSSPMPEPPSDALITNGFDQHQPEPEPTAPQAPYKSFRCAINMAVPG